MPATSPIDAPSGKPHFQRSFLNLSHQPYATGGSRSHAGLTAGTLYPTNRETQCEPALRATLRMLAHLCLARVTALRDEAVARRGRQARPSDKCVRALLQNSWCDLSRWKVPLAGPQAARCTAPPLCIKSSWVWRAIISSSLFRIRKTRTREWHGALRLNRHRDKSSALR
jgi:hypothetical protein